MRRREFLASTMFALGGFASENVLELLNPVAVARAQSGRSKPPTTHTLAANQKVLESLPFNERIDFELAQKGFIAGLSDGVITNVDGKVVFDARKFAIPLDQPPPDTWNPSLWRVSQLNGPSGLFKVVDRLYQIRSLDIANMTIMEGETPV